MSEVFVSYVDPLGKKGSVRSYITDDESEIDFLDRINYGLVIMLSDGYYIQRFEVK